MQEHCECCETETESAPVVRSDERRRQLGVDGLFVAVHQPRIAGHVGGRYRRQPTLGPDWSLPRYGMQYNQRCSTADPMACQIKERSPRLMSVIDPSRTFSLKSRPPVSTWDPGASSVPTRGTGRDMAKKNRDQREERLEKSSAKSASVVVPVTLHKGQPIGVQLIAGRYREDLALDAAAAIEKRAGILVPRLWEKMG